MSQIRQQGLTLIEMMIALILALLVTGTVLTIFISNVKSSAENIKMIQLNQELRASMNFMSDELKRHGFSFNATSTAMSTLNTATPGCVVYGYEQASGAVATIRGFRLEGAALEWSDQNTTGCANAAGNWQDLTSNNIEITTFDVDPTNTVSAASVTIQRLDVTLTGETQLNPGVAERTLRETIRIRNEDGT